jgi:hypothetical protein
MCSCCGAGVLRAAVKVIPEFVYSKASACACVKTEHFQVLEKNIYYNCPNCREKNKEPTHTPGRPWPAEILVWAG